MIRVQQLSATKKLIDNQLHYQCRNNQKFLILHQTFATSAKGSRGARGHGWLHHYRNGGGGRHLQGPWHTRDTAKLNSYNDEIFTMKDKRVANCFMEIGIGSDIDNASAPVVGRLDFELAYWALPNTCQRFMDFCSNTSNTTDDGETNVAYLNSKIHKIDKAIGIFGGETNTLNQNLLIPQQGSLLPAEGHCISHSSRGILSMCVIQGMVDSRFSITTGEDNPQLDGKFVAIGRMKNAGDGDQLLDDICKVYNRKGAPSLDIAILNCGVY